MVLFAYVKRRRFWLGREIVGRTASDLVHRQGRNYFTPGGGRRKGGVRRQSAVLFASLEVGCANLFAVYNFDIGLLLQNSKKLSINKKDEGHIFSINRKLSDKSSIYFQNAKSDMKIDDGEQRSFGYTYKINDKTKIFIHQSSRESSNKGKVDYISVGTEYKF